MYHLNLKKKKKELLEFCTSGPGCMMPATLEYGDCDE